MLLGLCEVVSEHLFSHLLRGDFWYPAQFLFGFAGVAQQSFDFGGSEVAGVDFDERNPLQG